jgi:diguanylate cyclase (GGDEF)-like protein
MASDVTDTSSNTDMLFSTTRLMPFFRRTFLAWLIFSLSLCITFIAWSITNKSHQSHTQDLFIFEVAQTVQTIQQRMKGYEQVLRGGIGLFKSSEHVSRQEFHDYVTNLEVDKHWPGIQGIGYAVMLRPEDKDAFVSALRFEGFNGFDIFPSGVRNKYSSILYLEPFTARNQRAFGYDMYSEKARHFAMDFARDNGDAAFSAKVKLVQENGDDLQNGFLVYLPLYRNGASIENVDQRRKELIGYVYSPFRMDNLIEGILLSKNKRQINFEIYDGSSESPEAILYTPRTNKNTNSLLDSDQEEFKPAFSVTKKVKFPGRDWTILFYSTSVFDSAVEKNLAKLIAFTGSVLSILLLIVLLNISISTRKLSTASDKSKILIDRLKAGVSAGIVGIWDWDVKNNILNWDAVMFSLFGLDKSYSGDIYDTWLARVHVDDRAYVAEEMQAALKNEREYCPEFRVLWPDNSVHYIKAASKTSFDESGNAIRVVGVNYDITEQKDVQMRLDKEASYDQLTQLPNRRLINDRLKQAIAFTDRNKKSMAILFIDLDGFKQVNDIYGHHAGDWLLREVSMRIQASLRATDTVGRLGGDEFIVILPAIYEHTVDVADKIRKALEEPFERTDEKALHISSSIGVAIYPEHAHSQALLIECADNAMYEAKKKGRNQVVVFENSQP